MRYGYFDDINKEYVITDWRTPLPWINYLGCENFFSLISNTGGGYSFYKDAKLLRLTRYRYNNTPPDNNGRYFYINENNTIWNPGCQPTQTPLDNYSCRHGLGYTIITGQKNNLLASVTTFVPIGDNCELNKITLKNLSSLPKTFTLFSYIEFCLWNAVDDMTNFQKNLNTGEVEVELEKEYSCIYHKTEYRERRDYYCMYSVNTCADGFDTQREAFLGPYSGTSEPDVVLHGKSQNSVAHGWAPVGSFQINITLDPGQETTYLFLLGFIKNKKDAKWEGPNIINKSQAKDLLSRYQSIKDVDHAFHCLKDYWNTLLSKYSIQTNDEKLCRMVNIWNQYQCMVTFNMSRSASYYESGTGRGMGFRDSCQDLLGFVHLIPDAARQRILDIASTQFEDGSAYHQYQPLTKKGNLDIGSGFHDDPMWLIAGTVAYLKETGDNSILYEKVAFNCDENNKATLFEHLHRSFTFTTTHLGPHGLPLIGRADWNDCLNLNCFSENPDESFQTTGASEGAVAESIFIAAMYVKYGRDYAKICEISGKAEEADTAFKKTAKMEESILKSGWDGEWFLRAFDAYSEKVGSHECKEGKIYIEPQGFCIMAGVGISKGLAQKALDSVEKHLDSPYGIALLSPAYTSYHLNLGEISAYPIGYKENGGIFCHNNPWISIAQTILGHGNKAFASYKKICPAYIEDISDIHRTEPYVYAQMIAGKEAPTHGEAKNSWLTGTAAWSFTAISQYILGIRPDFDGLIIDPCIPTSIKTLRVERSFRNANYHILIQNPSGKEKGISILSVNQKIISGNLIPYNPEIKDFDIIAIM